MSSPPSRTSLTINEDLVPFRPLVTPTITTLSFSSLLNTPLQLQVDPSECGGQLWPAGMVLAKYLLRCRLGELRGKTILELGAGSGLVGLALALALESNPLIYLTDLDILLPLLRTNIGLNPLRTPCVATHLPWGTSSIPPDVPKSPDIVLAADCVYFEPSFPLLIETMRELIGKETLCYFCFKKRRKADMTFMKSARKLFDVKDVMDDPDRGVWEREGVFMYEIRKRAVRA